MRKVVVHYAEIGLKGKNRQFFERKLIQNIEKSLGSLCIRVYRLYGRIVIEHSGKTGEISDRLLKVPGIANFSFALSSGLDIDDIRKNLQRAATKQRKISTFAVSSSRSNKGFGYTSRQLNEALGDFLRKRFRWKVDLARPDVKFYVEITEKEAFVYSEKIKGLGGLPVTSSGKLVSLISGGIDSPVAAFEMMRRGCSIVFVHFHNLTRQKDVVKDKVERIVRVLSGFQPRTKLYMVPFGDIQHEITAKVPSRYRMLVYRRLMFAITNRIALREKALGFVTGDSIGQVASQTPENLSVIYDSAELPVFSPLIGTGKDAITRKAMEIGTYEISILPYHDCCSHMVAQHPETRASLPVIQDIEKRLDIEKLVKLAIQQAKTDIS